MLLCLIQIDTLCLLFSRKTKIFVFGKLGNIVANYFHNSLMFELPSCSFYSNYTLLCFQLYAIYLFIQMILGKRKLVVHRTCIQYYLLFSSLPAFPLGLRGQQLEIKPPHFTVFHHIHRFAWVRSQEIPSKILLNSIENLHTELSCWKLFKRIFFYLSRKIFAAILRLLKKETKKLSVWEI